MDSDFKDPFAGKCRRNHMIQLRKVYTAMLQKYLKSSAEITFGEWVSVVPGSSYFNPE